MISWVYSIAKPFGVIDPAADYKMALLGTGYTIDTLDDYFGDISAHEISSAGYTAGGQALTGVAASEDAVNEEGILSCDTINWSGLTATVRFAVLYKDTGDPATSPLICGYQFDTDQVLAGQNLRLTNTSGIIRNV